MDALNPNESQALWALGPDTWRLDKLPAGVSQELLESLDVLRLIEVRSHSVRTTKNLHGREINVRTAPAMWYSPTFDKGDISSWPALFKRAREKPAQAAEVRLTAKGRRELHATSERRDKDAKESAERFDRRMTAERERQNREAAEGLRALLARPLSPEEAVAKLRAMSELGPGAVLPDTYDSAAAIVVRMSQQGYFKEYPRTSRHLLAHDARPVSSSLIGPWVDFSSDLRMEIGLPRSIYAESFRDDARLAADIVEAAHRQEGTGLRAPARMTGWTKAELCREADIKASTFDRIRKGAKVRTGPSGDTTFLFSIEAVFKLIDRVERGPHHRIRQRVVDKWTKLITDAYAPADLEVSRKMQSKGDLGHH